MSPRESSYSADDLLGKTAWMRCLARSLVRDEATADDVVQDTWLALLERPQRDLRSDRSWLARVLRNRANRSYRDALRTRRREAFVAREEAERSTPEAVVERAELQRAVIDAVLGLDEPYRSTLLLRYFEELTADEIAAREDVPVATVRTRIRRALERLRASLDCETAGGRSAWTAGLVAIAGLGSTKEAAIEASALATGSSLSPAASASSGFSLFTSGTLLMSQKTILAATCASALTLAAGFGIGRWTTPETAAEALATGKVVERKALDALQEELDRAKSEAETLASDRSKLAQENETLAERAGTLAASLESLKSEAAAEEAVARAEAAGHLPVEFGKLAELEAFRHADWKSLAEAADNMNALWLDLIARQERGEPMPADFPKNLQAQNAKLVAFAAGIMGKVPTNSPVNGEFTHPLALSNLMAAVLERSGHPFTPEQKKEIGLLGEEYEAAWDELQATYGENTPQLRKVIDELELKDATTRATRDLLSADQRDVIVHPELTDRMQMDVLSPFTMAILLTKSVSQPSASDFQGVFIDRVLENYSIPAERRGELQPALDQYLSDIAPLLEEPGDPKAPIRLDQALQAGRAHAALLDALIALPDLPAETRTQLLTNPGWPVPMVAKESK